MIRIDNLMPHPLASFPHGESSIWGKKFEIDLAERTLLNASSGKGKTTFIALLYGLRNDYNGSAYIFDEDIKTFNADAWTKIRRSTFSIIFQDLQLLPQLSLVDNLKIKHILGSDLTMDEIITLITHLGLGDKLNQKCGTLSYGQQQRVAIVRALIPNFKYLMMDEPFSHLDKENADLAMELIFQRCEHLNAGCLMTSLGNIDKTKFQRNLYL